jgi:DNA-binding SARP family transcriptional activator
VEFGILGPLEVVGPDGPAVVRGAKRRGLLAYLLVHAGEAVSLDRLVEELWDEPSSSGARGRPRASRRCGGCPNAGFAQSFAQS